MQRLPICNFDKRPAGEAPISPAAILMDLCLPESTKPRQSSRTEKLFLSRFQGQNYLMRILIVCTGNILRSVMAEHLLRSELPSDISVDSAGYPCKRTGINPRPATRKAMKEIDLDVSAHRSKRLTPQMLDRSDLILVQCFS